MDERDLRTSSALTRCLRTLGLPAYLALAIVACTKQAEPPSGPEPSAAQTPPAQQKGAVDERSEKPDTVSLIFDDDEEIDRWRERIPFITLEIGPFRVHRDTPWQTDGRLYMFSGGDADGWHSYIALSQVAFGSELAMTEEDMSDWKTEHGFGYGSSLDEVVTMIGEPTQKVAIRDLNHYFMTSTLDTSDLDADDANTITMADFQAYVYRWEYPTQIDENLKYTAVYTLTILHEEAIVTGIIIDVEEAP